MRVPRLLLLEQPLSPGQCVVTGDAAHYLARVLRRRPGDPVIVCDGRGGAFAGRIDEVDGRRAEITLLEPCALAVESPLETHLGIALLRGDRMDYALQKSVELGVSRISLLLTERVEVRLDGRRQDKRMQHFQGVLAHALQQSGRLQLPQLAPPQPLTNWIDELPKTGRRLVLDPEGDALVATSTAATVRQTVLASGPEGGFTAAEIEELVVAGFERVRLGPRILRAETAPLVGLAVLQTRFGDLAACRT